MTNKEINNEVKLWAFLGVLLTVVGFVLVLLLKRDNKYAMFYAKQGLVLFFGFVVASIASWALQIIPVLGNIVSGLLSLIVVILWIIGMVYSLSGKEKDVALVGELARKINI